jgi:hypothetical protein
MGTSLPEIPNITVPQEEEALQSALADLDHSLTAYAAALHEADARLRQMVHPSQTQTDRKSQTGPQEKTPSAPAAGVPVPQQRLRDVATQPPTPKKQPQAEPSAAAPAVAPAAAAEPPTEEEALLASLDEPTSKAIRVLRRLNPNRFVQELLKQVEERKDAPGHAAKPANKSWFRRG